MKMEKTVVLRACSFNRNTYFMHSCAEIFFFKFLFLRSDQTIDIRLLSEKKEKFIEVGIILLRGHG